LLSPHNLAKKTELEAATTVLGKAFQISTPQFDTLRRYVSRECCDCVGLARRDSSLQLASKVWQWC